MRSRRARTPRVRLATAICAIACRNFIALNAPSLVRQLTRRTGCRELARELAQDAFLKLLRLTPATLVGVQQPDAYIRRMSVNLLHDWGRGRAASERAHPTLEVLAADQMVDQVAVLESRDTLRKLQAAVERMKPRTREIFLAHRITEMGSLLQRVRLVLSF